MTDPDRFTSARQCARRVYAPVQPPLPTLLGRRRRTRPQRRGRRCPARRGPTLEHGLAARIGVAFAHGSVDAAATTGLLRGARPDIRQPNVDQPNPQHTAAAPATMNLVTVPSQLALGPRGDGKGRDMMPAVCPAAAETWLVPVRIQERRLAFEREEKQVDHAEGRVVRAEARAGSWCRGRSRRCFPPSRGGTSRRRFGRRRPSACPG